MVEEKRRENYVKKKDEDDKTGVDGRLGCGLGWVGSKTWIGGIVEKE